MMDERLELGAKLPDFVLAVLYEICMLVVRLAERIELLL
jgi:hypothetical protein